MAITLVNTKKSTLKRPKVSVNVILGIVLVGLVSFLAMFQNPNLSLYTYTGVEIKIDTTTAISITSTADCLVERGSSGKWVYDLDYANRTNYRIGSTSPTADWHIAADKFRATKEQPFRLATAWRWQDETCPVHELTSLSEFCQTASKLNLTRFLIMGDSLNSEFVFSFRSLLGHPPSVREASFNGRYRPFEIPCSINNTIQFWLYRRSPPGDWTYLQREADSNGTLANDYRKFVESNDKGTTAIIANVGAWMNSMEDYVASFQAFLNWIDSFPETTDIITFFRPTIPGHQDCMPLGGNGTDNKELATTFNWSHPVHQAPHLNYDDYFSVANHSRLKFEFNWLDFERYNQYSKQVLENRTLLSSSSLSLSASSSASSSSSSSSSSLGEVVGMEKKPMIQVVHWLNIFNSSVLRRDGHIGFNDCLHYYLPGPTDWWVHFFYSHLLEIANNNNNNN